jgi:hypothetical protein
MTKPRRPVMRMLLAVSVAGLALAGVARAVPAPDSPSAAQSESELRKEFESLKAAWELAYREFVDAAGKGSVYPAPDEWVPRFQAVADKDPKAPAAASCIAWIAEKSTQVAVQGKAIDRLDSVYFASPAVGTACAAIQYSFAPNAEGFLRHVMEAHPVREAKGLGHYALAKLLVRRAEFAASLREGGERRRKIYDKQFGPGYVVLLEAGEPAELMKEAEKLLDGVVSTYADVAFPPIYRETIGKTLGELAKRDLFEIRDLAIGRTAPEIVGKDADGKEMKLSEFRGKVVVLDFWGFG